MITKIFKGQCLIICSLLFSAALTSCADYEGSKLEVMTPSTVTFDHATATMQGCSMSGSITDIVDCYLTLTSFDGQNATVKLGAESYDSDLFQSTSSNGVFLTKISLKLSENFYTLQSQNQLASSYDYSFKPGKLTAQCFVHKSTGVDSTYTFTCANVEKAGTVVGDSIDGKPGPVSEAVVKAWMKTIYDSGVKATFTYMLNEQGWPVAFTKNDDLVEYDYE